ncbi:arylesterase [Sphingomonas sp.]|uniref:arylesterase n=1 Tax=Sphingomonas sp. TaxID=28214 RepID=UPI003B3BB14D
MSVAPTLSITPYPYILALGDSLTAGHGLPRGASFADRLEYLLRAHYPHAAVVNAGVSGDTSAAALRRLPTVLSALRHRPSLAIVELGANDLLRGVPPARTLADLDMIVQELRRCGIPVLLATLEPPPMLAALGLPYDDIYAQVSARHDVARHPFFPPGLLGHPDFVLPDRLHPNAAAIERVARHMLAPVLAELSKTQAAA